MKLFPPYPFRSERCREAYHALYMQRAKSWPVPSETRLIDTLSGQTSVRLSGDLASPPLVLLPGSRASSLAWIPNIAALSAHYRTYALDAIYDVGLSVARRKLTGADDLMQWLDEVLAVLAPEGAVRLAGISYGGWLAALFALHFPQRVQRLVLIAPAGTVLPVSFSFFLRALLLVFPRAIFVRPFLDWLLQDTVHSGEAGRAYVDAAVEDWRLALRCFRGLPLIPATVLKDQELRAFPVPTLYLDGEHEKVYSAHKAVRRLNRIAPQIQAEVIPGAGHDLWVVQAERVNRKLIDFLGAPG